MAAWRDGSTSTTKIGFVNRNRQKVHGTRGVKGTDHGQYSYKLECLAAKCGHIYGANGTDIHLRKCPECQGGCPGIDF